jgi:hypothetical protein
MVDDHRADYGSELAAMTSIAGNVEHRFRHIDGDVLRGIGHHVFSTLHSDSRSRLCMAVTKPATGTSAFC